MFGFALQKWGKHILFNVMAHFFDNLILHGMDISIEDDERTITMIDPFHGDSDPCNNVPGAIEASNDSGVVNPQGSGGQQEEPEESSKSAEKNREEII